MAANGGTIAREILNERPQVKSVVFPVGGGGLSSRLCFYFKEKSPSVHLIGCQHKESAALALSLKMGKAIRALPPIETIAGGIEGGIGEGCFEILKNRINQILLVSEEEIEEAFRFVLKHHQLLIEPSAVVTVAALLSKKNRLKGETVVLLSGRNVSYETVQRLLIQ
jgi:threonine dehydratase